MLLVLKPDQVLSCSTVTDLQKIDLQDKSNFLKVKDINIGFATHECISGLKKVDAVTSKQVVQFINDVITFISSLLGRIFEKSPLKSAVVMNASIFDPCVLATEETEMLQSKMKNLLKHLF